MVSLQKEYSKQKLFGQIYTPNFIVCKILDEVGYFGKDILGKTILDPACGDGRFLEEIVKRVIKYSPHNDLEKNLNNIYGWDIDKDAIVECIKNLDNLIKNYNISVKWNIHVKNSLINIEKQKSLFDSNSSQDLKYDFIVGNPPYIRIQHLEENERKFIQNNFRFCNSGSTDIFIAFFELAKNLLNENGICSFISPNSYFSTDTAKKLREFLADNHLISIYDFGEIQVFDNVSTYTCITTFNNKKHDYFLYYKAKTVTNFDSRKIETKILKNKKFWQLSIEDKLKKTGTRLGDICNIYVGLATLCDKAYIFDIIDDLGEYFLVNTKFSGKVKIEKGILKPIIKVSKFKKQVILFPYFKDNIGKHKILLEETLKKEFPFAYEYLLSVKQRLDKRSSEKIKDKKWYEFGRNQSLDSSFGKKIVFSTMSEKPNFVLIEDENSTFYSGYGIKYDGDYNELLKILNSKEMEDFMNISGRNLRGGWKSYNKKVVDEFIF